MPLCNCWRSITFQHKPQNAVIKLIVQTIGCAKIQPLGHACGCRILRIFFIQVLRGDDCVIRRKVGRRCEDVRQGSAEVIKFRESTHTQNV